MTPASKVAALTAAVALSALVGAGADASAQEAGDPALDMSFEYAEGQIVGGCDDSGHISRFCYVHLANDDALVGTGYAVGYEDGGPFHLFLATTADDGPSIDLVAPALTIDGVQPFGLDDLPKGVVNRHLLFLTDEYGGSAERILWPVFAALHGGQALTMVLTDEAGETFTAEFDISGFGAAMEALHESAGMAPPAF